MSAAKELEQLMEIIKRLRAPDGCPWDRVQNQMSIRRCLVEETGEYLDALEQGNDEEMCEELGDLLLQVAFNCQMTEEQGKFNLEEVIRRLNQKLVGRHEHVFGSEKAANASEALSRWEKCKNKESAKQQRQSVMDGVARHLPALSRAQKASVKAARCGFDWPTIDGAVAKVEEEWQEVKEAMREANREAIYEELGDLLFAITVLCRKQQYEAEECLQAATGKFIGRFKNMEETLKKNNEDMASCSLAKLSERWQATKQN